MIFNDPSKGLPLEFTLIDRNDIINGRFQRELSKGLRSKILLSISHGFVVPVIVTQSGDKFEVLDGQHRIAAMDELHGTDWQVPAVVVPNSFLNIPLILNVEKADNIKDKCTKIHNLYMWHVENSPEKLEVELAQSVGFHSYLFTLAFAHKEFHLASPSLVETVTKMLDTEFFKDPLLDSLETRREYAKVVADIEATVNSIASENNITDFNLKRAILSRSKDRLWGRKRSVEEDFLEGFASLKLEMLGTNWSYLGRV